MAEGRHPQCVHHARDSAHACSSHSAPPSLSTVRRAGHPTAHLDRTWAVSEPYLSHFCWTCFPLLGTSRHWTREGPRWRSPRLDTWLERMCNTPYPKPQTSNTVSELQSPRKGNLAGCSEKKGQRGTRKGAGGLVTIFPNFFLQTLPGCYLFFTLYWCNGAKTKL